MTEKKTITHLDLTKLTKILTKKIQCEFCFISVGVWTIQKFLVCIKNFGQYKKLPLDKLARKKDTVVQEMLFLQLQGLDDLVAFLELSVFINASLP